MSKYSSGVKNSVLTIKSDISNTSGSTTLPIRSNNLVFTPNSVSTLTANYTFSVGNGSSYDNLFSITNSTVSSVKPFSITDTTASSSSTTGSLIVSGGAGVAGNLYVGGTIFGAINGTISTSTVQVTSDGTVSAPAYSWTADSNTGFYRIGSSNIAITLGGTKYVDFSTSTSTFTNTLTAAKSGDTTATNSSLVVNPASTALTGASQYYFTYLAPPTTTAIAFSGTASTLTIGGEPTVTTGGTGYALNIMGGTSIFGGNIQTNAGCIKNPLIITSTTSLTTTSSNYVVATSGTFTITLPSIQTTNTNGLEFYITNLGTGIITLTVANTGSEVFDNSGSTSFILDQYTRIHIIAFTNIATSQYIWQTY